MLTWIEVGEPEFGRVARLACIARTATRTQLGCSGRRADKAHGWCTGLAEARFPALGGSVRQLPGQAPSQRPKFGQGVTIGCSQLQSVLRLA